MSEIKITYSPEGGSERSWVVDMVNPAWDLQYNTEVATSWPWVEFQDKLASNSAIAIRALIWTLRKRDEPRLGLDDVQVRLGEINAEPVVRPEAPEPDPKD